MRVEFLLILCSTLFSVAASSTHEPGYCAVYDNCGKKSFFGSVLPCAVDEFKAIDATQEAVDELGQICGIEWLATEKVCCTIEQISTLKENLKKADALISSCPACLKNFRNLFCQFTCSSNQSTFIDVTKTAKSIDKGLKVVTELEYFIDEEFAQGFYDSCKNIKFGATNGFALDLLGGGATNYKEFLKFLGDEKPLLGGSPFQIDFKYNDSNETLPSGMEYLNTKVYNCSDPIYKCSCSDCPDKCPTLDKVSYSQCKVGYLPCFSFAVIMVYLGLGVISLAFLSWANRSRRVQLLEESAYSNHLTSDSVLDLPEQLRFEAYSLNNTLENWFGKLAYNCASFPATILSITLIIAGILSSGIYFNGQLETNPVNLWVSSNADAFKEKQYFDENFGPFYRTEQIFVVSTTVSPVLTNEVVLWWQRIEKEITSMIVEDLSYDDLCFKPTPDSTCVLESFTQYFDGPLPRGWQKSLKDCADTPVNCLPSFGQPLRKELLFGDYDESTGDVLTSKAFVITFLLNNSENSTIIQNATKWENKLEEYLLNLKTPTGIRISFNTEPSLESELNKSTNTDAKIVVISYLVMFLYASLSLGGTFNLLKTRFSLGLSGIVIVLLSVTSSAGFFSFIGVKSTLIIAEVIPFLILAVGVDNIFLITHELKTINFSYPNESIAFRISKAVGRMGPSILLSSSSQFFTFALASSVSMPAVRNFALYSAGAVLLNSILQLTAFISLLSLDQKRIDDGRLDCFPCLRQPSESIHLNEIDELFENENEKNYFDKLLTDFTPVILNSKKIIVSTFLIWTGISLVVLPEIRFGLDQRIAVPSDSYLVSYFNDVYQYFNAGPPVYFVVKDLDITQRANQQKLCGKFTTCDEFSLSNILEQERKRSEVSTIAEPLANWLDDYLTFLNPELDDCCRLKKNADFEVCSPHAPARQCETCYVNKTWAYSMDGFPENEEFLKYFNIWINAPPDPCPIGGKAGYSSAINYDNTSIIASTFRTSHVPLRSQDDFIQAYEESNRILDELKEKLDYEDIFAYSPFYIFFVQYSTIVSLTFTLISIALGFIFINSSILLGSFRASFVLVFTVTMILINIGGVMAIWQISLNAVSLVNLVICVGLAVEFCVHITRAFVVSDKDSRLNNIDFRAYNAITGIGSAVFGGICTTKFIGVTVLAFTQSKIFEVYYFRMWLSLVIIGSLHALIFLPVALTIVGGKRYVFSENSTSIADGLDNRMNDMR